MGNLIMMVSGLFAAPVAKPVSVDQKRVLRQVEAFESAFGRNSKTAKAWRDFYNQEF